MTKSSASTLDLDRPIEAATAALLATQRADGHFLFELEADATIPAEYVLLRHYLGEPVDAALEAKIAAYLRRIQGAHGGWPLFHDGEFDMSATVKAYFALKMIGDQAAGAAHAPRPRGDPCARRRRAGQCVHPLPVSALWHRAVARGAGNAGRDRAPAEMVSVPSRQDLVLEPHRHRAASGADGEEAAGGERQGRRHRRIVSRAAGLARADAEGAAAEGVVVLVLPRRRQCAARGGAAVSQAHAGARRRSRGGLGRRAAQRRGRARRDFSGDGQQRDDVRRAGLSGRSSAARHRAPIDREAPGRAWRRGLLPALRVADLGHRACLPCAVGGRRRTRGCTGQARSRLAQTDAGARCARRLDRTPPGPAARRLGLPICQSALSRRRRHRGGGDGDGPHATSWRCGLSNRDRARA